MRMKIRQTLLFSLIFLLILISFLLLKQNLAYKNIIGDFAARTIWNANVEIEKAIQYLEGTNLKEEEVKNHLDNIIDFGMYNASVDILNLDLQQILTFHYDSKRICNDKLYRDNTIEKIREIGELTSYIIENYGKDKEEHYTYKYKMFLGDDYSSIIYYDYLRKNKDSLNNMINNILKS